MITGQQAILSFGKKLYGDKFEIKENLIEPYRAIYNHFSFSGDGEYLPKGVGLIGAKGLSKSSIMRIMHILFKDTSHRFRSTTSQKLYLKLEEDKLKDILDEYTVECSCDLYIDDIGVKKEDGKKVYGNTISLLSELFNLRYEIFVESGFKTHWSSNLPTRIPKDKIIKDNPNLSEQKKQEILNIVTLEDVYGERLVDRMIEMNDIITFKGQSLR